MCRLFGVQLEDCEDVKSQGTAVLAADGYGAVNLQELSDEYTAARRAGGGEYPSSEVF